jgi:multisubunit Na+/H+ antiporter MnhE subunit
MRLVVELALWWSALTAGYLLLVTSPTGLEVAVGVAVGCASAAAGVAARRAFRPPSTVPGFVRRVVLLPADVAADTVSLTRALVSGRAFTSDFGAVDEVVLPDTDDATRAWSVLLVSASPGSLAMDVEDRGGRLVLSRHRLTAHHHVSATAGSP